MLLRQLEYLVAVEREQHFGRAAASCHVSQSALSEGIRRLEEELGASIIQRGRAYEGLTPEGERVVAWAHRILADREGMRDDLAALRGEITGEIRIGAIPAAMRVTAGVVARLCAARPMLHATLLSLSSVEIERRLAIYDIDAGVTYLDNEPLHGVRSIPVATERFVLITAAAATSRDTITWAEASRLPLCLLTPDMQNRRIIDAAFAAAGVSARPQIQADTVPALLDHVARGPWASVVSGEWVADNPSTLVAVPLVDPVVEHVIGVVVPDRDLMSSRTAALLTAADEYAHQRHERHT